MSKSSFISSAQKQKKKKKQRREGEYLDVPCTLTNADNEAFKKKVW